jgi:hypothetical protein
MFHKTKMIATKFLVISLLINVLVAGACSILLFIDVTPFTKSFGADDTSRQILSCIYLSIAVTSLFALAVKDMEQMVVWGLLLIQIIYKLLTVAVVKDKSSPIIWTNLGIAMFHTITLILLKKQI